MEKLYELVEEGGFDLVVVDTPPTRNALDFLDAPRRLTRFLENRVFQALMKPTRAGLRVMGVAAQALLRTISKVAGADIVQDAVAFFQAFEGMEEGFRTRAARVRRAPGRSRAPPSCWWPRRGPTRSTRPCTSRTSWPSRGCRSTALVVNRVQPRFADRLAARRPCRHGPQATGRRPRRPGRQPARLHRSPPTARSRPMPTWSPRSPRPRSPGPAPQHRRPRPRRPGHRRRPALRGPRSARHLGPGGPAGLSQGGLTCGCADHPRGQRRSFGPGRGDRHRQPADIHIQEARSGPAVLSQGGRRDPRSGRRRPPDGQHGRHGGLPGAPSRGVLRKPGPYPRPDAARPPGRRVPGPSLGCRGMGGEAARPDPAPAGGRLASRRRHLLRRVLPTAVDRVRTARRRAPEDRSPATVADASVFRRHTDQPPSTGGRPPAGAPVRRQGPPATESPIRWRQTPRSSSSRGARRPPRHHGQRGHDPPGGRRRPPHPLWPRT